MMGSTLGCHGNVKLKLDENLSRHLIPLDLALAVFLIDFSLQCGTKNLYFSSAKVRLDSRIFREEKVHDGL